jgi:hypothetical protein
MCFRAWQRSTAQHRLRKQHSTTRLSARRTPNSERRATPQSRPHTGQGQDSKCMQVKQQRRLQEEQGTRHGHVASTKPGLHRNSPWPCGSFTITVKSENCNQ